MTGFTLPSDRGLVYQSFTLPPKQEFPKQEAAFPAAYVYTLLGSHQELWTGRARPVQEAIRCTHTARK